MNNPFRYRPSGEMVTLMWKVVCAVSADPALHEAFRGGKMLGILRHRSGWTVGYSGKRMDIARSVRVDEEEKTFVPPVYDVTCGPFKEKEAEISAMNKAVEMAPDEETAAQLKLKRATESIKLQKWTFGQYVMLNARGEKSSVLEIFSHKGILPPAAAGDCAAPKLLQHAYLNGLEPIELAEFWYGLSPAGPVRAQGRFYPACSWKCGPILGFMLQGLEIEGGLTEAGEPEVLHEDSSIIVVNKPSGMPSVPGLDGLLSLQEWLGSKYGGEIFQVHRLDQDTSGVMVFARSRKDQGILQRQFENRTTIKEYAGVLSCQPAGGRKEGTIDLPLGPDFEDKPRQKVDPVQGKPASTEYRIIEGKDAERIFSFFGIQDTQGLSAAWFRPHTGRSHQIRVHSAHPDGLGAPILGDTLYGGATSLRPERLCLHAASLTFCHPMTGEEMTFKAFRE